MPPWDAARAASRRPLPRPRKLHGPVGATPRTDYGEPACQGCGYHVCAPSCEHAKYDARFCAGCDRLVCVCDGVFRPEPGVTYTFPVIKELERGQVHALPERARMLVDHSDREAAEPLRPHRLGDSYINSFDREVPRTMVSRLDLLRTLQSGVMQPADGWGEYGERPDDCGCAHCSLGCLCLCHQEGTD